MFAVAWTPITGKRATVLTLINDFSALNECFNRFLLYQLRPYVKKGGMLVCMKVCLHASLLG